MSSVGYNMTGGTYDVVTDYYIDPYYDPESFEVFSHTDWTLTYTPLGQPTQWLTGGESEGSGFVSWPIGFSFGPYPAQGTLSFEAVNRWTTEAVSYALGITDAAMTTEAVRVTGGAQNDLMMLGSGDDVVGGGDGNDWIDAWLGDDVLRGGGGDDVLDGGAGADRMVGGMGDDRYVVESALDRVIERADGGSDTVSASVSWTLSANVEHLTLAGVGDLSGRGNDLANQINGNAGTNVLRGEDGDDFLAGHDGDDELIGGEGNDVLSGGPGDDRMVGGAGNDAYEIDSAGDRYVEAADGGIDTIYTTFKHYRLGDTVENLSFITYDAVGIGNAKDNLMIGAQGNDVLRGREGNDILSGFTGTDRFLGGSGADVFRFDRYDSEADARDTVLDFSQQEGDRIDLSWVGGLTFRGEDGFSGAGHEVVVSHAHGNTFVEVDPGAPGVATLSIRLIGTIELGAADFIL